MSPGVRYLPDRDRISVLAGLILLAFLVTPYVNLPSFGLTLPLPGVVLPLQLNFRTLVSVLVAGLTASGANWLIRDHPSYQGDLTIQHWLLPALTAGVTGSVLFTVPYNPLWWAALTAGGLILILVLVAEYIVVDPRDARFPLASAGLSALAFGLYLALAITLHNAELRLFLRLPALTGAAALVSLRIIRLRRTGDWAIWETAVVVLICAQLVATLHYWPLSSAGYGLLLLAPLYTVINFLAVYQPGGRLLQAALEPALIAVLLLAAAFWLGRG